MIRLSPTALMMVKATSVFLTDTLNCLSHRQLNEMNTDESARCRKTLFTLILTTHGGKIGLPSLNLSAAGCALTRYVLPVCAFLYWK